MSGDDVDDVVNEALVRLIDKISLMWTLDCYILSAYIVSNVRSIAIRRILRRDRPQQYAFFMERCFPNLMREGEGIDAPLLRRETAKSVKQAILRLSERDRLALTMKYSDDLADADTARTLGVGKNSVRPMLLRARRRMREAIEA